MKRYCPNVGHLGTVKKIAYNVILDKIILLIGNYYNYLKDVAN